MYWSICTLQWLCHMSSGCVVHQCLMTVQGTFKSPPLYTSWYSSNNIILSSSTLLPPSAVASCHRLLPHFYLFVCHWTMLIHTSFFFFCIIGLLSSASRWKFTFALSLLLIYYDLALLNIALFSHFQQYIQLSENFRDYCSWESDSLCSNT